MHTSAKECITGNGKFTETRRQKKNSVKLGKVKNEGYKRKKKKKKGKKKKETK